MGRRRDARGRCLRALRRRARRNVSALRLRSRSGFGESRHGCAPGVDRADADVAMAEFAPGDEQRPPSCVISTASAGPPPSRTGRVEIEIIDTAIPWVETLACVRPVRGARLLTVAEVGPTAQGAEAAESRPGYRLAA